jgi:HPt (histidine-containing phosphotransfer) domain-containing protein
MPLNLTDQETSPIDVQELLDRCMGNFNLAERVLAKLQSRFDEDMVELERALSSKDDRLIASIAHRLKGAASNVAAHELQKCAARIEELANNHLMDPLSGHFDALRKQWSRLNDSALSDMTAGRLI